MTSISTHHVAEATPHELRGYAGEEDVIRVLGNAAKRAEAGARAIALADLNARREWTANPLPHEDPDFQGQADGPHRHKGGRGGGGSDGLV